MFSFVCFGLHLIILTLHADFISAQQVHSSSDHAHANQILQSRNGYGYGYGYNGYYPVASNYGYNSLSGIGEIVLGVLATLAGLALLASIVTALAAPLALFTGRKRRDIDDDASSSAFKDVATLHQFIQSIDSVDILPQRLMANYLSCTGLVDEKNQCLEKLICEFSRPNAKFSSLEKKALDVILPHLTDNQFIESEFKNRLLKAKSGHNDNCKSYKCHYF